VVTRVMKALNERRICMNGAKIVMLGIAYKEDIEDMRESPALKVLEHLEKNLAHVSVVDPYVSQFEWEGKIQETVPLSNKLLGEADLILITTGHKKGIDYSLVVKHAGLIFDTKNTLGKMGFVEKNIIQL
ncbi:UDP binding domain-containing protein, partial [Mesotoga sp.]|uniref:UDP binding domain-containing protein n=1 Tax=Mesotoga sp. TaxID=2053577 RepID=UPI00345E839C